MTYDYSRKSRIGKAPDQPAKQPLNEVRVRRTGSTPDSMPPKPINEQKQPPAQPIEFPKTKHVKPQGYPFIPKDPNDEILQEMEEQRKRERDCADEFDIP